MPEVLLSGNHAEIRRWRKREALARTLARRPGSAGAAALGRRRTGRFLRELAERSRRRWARLSWSRKSQLTERPAMKSGDTVRVHVKVREGDKERIQIFEGIVIGMHRGGTRASFTVRKVSFGQGVERIFPLHSPTIQKVEVMRSAKVRRAKLYYLRDLKGKAARMKEVAKTSQGRASTKPQAWRCPHGPRARDAHARERAAPRWVLSCRRRVTRSAAVAWPARSSPARSSSIPTGTFPASRDSKLVPAPSASVLRRDHRARRRLGGRAAEPAEIDDINIHRASLQAMRRAMLSLAPLPDIVLVDAFRIPDLPMAQRGVLHGDRRCTAIAAASIVAKVTRDRQMLDPHGRIPATASIATKATRRPTISTRSHGSATPKCTDVPFVRQACRSTWLRSRRTFDTIDLIDRARGSRSRAENCRTADPAGQIGPGHR